MNGCFFSAQQLPSPRSDLLMQDIQQVRIQDPKVQEAL